MMTNQFSNMPFQNEGLKGHMSFQVRKNYFQHCLDKSLSNFEKSKKLKKKKKEKCGRVYFL